jgi:hypothetical protein
MASSSYLEAYFIFMKKETFYFSHDYNARNDTKILYMRQELGMEGYGIYWYLIEALADSGGILPLKIVPVLAKQMDSTLIKVEGVIMKYELFEVADNQFFSQRLIKHLELREALSEAGKIGAANRWKNGVANGVAIGLPNAKERKGKKIKEKEIKGSYYKKEDFNEVPEYIVFSVIQQFQISKQQTITEKQVTDMWQVFKEQNLTGDKFYNNENEVYKHFVNWINKQKFEKNAKPTAEDKFNAYKEYANRYS